jgi:hypothetical protein
VGEIMGEPEFLDLCTTDFGAGSPPCHMSVTKSTSKSPKNAWRFLTFRASNH